MVDLVTRYCSICATERESPASPLDGLEATPSLLRAAFERAGAAAAAAGWSPPEVVAHLADTEIVFGWRLRQILAEDEPVLAPYDEQLWASALRYDERDMSVALATFAAVRAADVELIRRAGDAALSRTYVQPEYGRRTLGELLQHRADHDIQHLRQIEAAEARS